MRDFIETFTTSQLAGVAVETASLRKDLDHAMVIIEGRIGEDRTILNLLQHQVGRLQSNQGDESATVNSLRDHMYRVEQAIVGVWDSGTAAVSTLHNELMAYKCQPATEVVQPVSDEQLQADVHDLRTHLDALTARLRNDITTLYPTTSTDGCRRPSKP